MNNITEKKFVLNGKEIVYKTIQLNWNETKFLLDSLDIEYTSDMDGDTKRTVFAKLADALNVNAVEIIDQSQTAEV